MGGMVSASYDRLIDCFKVCSCSSKQSILCTMHLLRPHRLASSPWPAVTSYAAYEHRKLRALVQFRVGHICCPLSKAGLSAPASLAIFAGAIFAAPRLLEMSFMTFLTALALVPSGLSFPTSFRRLQAPCACSCGTKRPKGCQSLPHSHSANGPDMNTDPSS